jgi:microcystin-dependent protein
MMTIYRTLVALCLLIPGATSAQVFTGNSGGSQSHPNEQPALAVTHAIAVEGTFPSRNGSPEGLEPFLGEVQTFAFDFAPRGWLLADGQLLQISQHQALFSLLGTTYGGDGRTTFALPDLRGQSTMHWGQGPGLSNRTIGQVVGASSHTLTKAELPIHEHTWPSGLTDPTGGGMAHNNMAPTLGLSRTVAVQGTFPSRNSPPGESLERFLGEIDTYAFNFAPRGFERSDGQLLPIQSNSALFSLLGTTYGGDGRTTFGLPDLQGRVAIHQGKGPGLTTRVIGQSLGQEEVQLSPSEMAVHDHSLPAGGNTGNTGGGQAHQNMQPSLTVNYCIALEGTFPSRTEFGEDVEPFIGEIQPYAFGFCPRGWADAEGQLLQIAQHPALFSLILTTYGGDGRTTFGLPDLRGRTPMHPDGSTSIGTSVGGETVTLTVDQLPSHNHAIPEPSSALLTLIGSTLLLGYRKKK